MEYTFAYLMGIKYLILFTLLMGAIGLGIMNTNLIMAAINALFTMVLCI